MMYTNEESGKIIWRDQKQHRKDYLPKNKGDLDNGITLIEFKYDETNKFDPFEALIQAILTDAKSPGRTVHRYYGGIVLPSENCIFIDNIKNKISWHLLETIKGPPSAWKKNAPYLYQDLSNLKNFKIEEPVDIIDIDFVKKILQNNLNQNSKDSDIVKAFNISFNFGFSQSKIIKRRIKENSWLFCRQKELDQYYTSTDHRKAETKLLLKYGITTIYDPCCGCLKSFDDNITYFGNDIDPDILIENASKLDTFKTPLNDLIKSMEKAGPVFKGQKINGQSCISTNPPFSKQNKIAPLDYLYDQWLTKTKIKYFGCWMAEDYMTYRKYKCIEMIKTKVKDWPGLGQNGSSQREKLIVYLLFDRDAPEVDSLQGFEFTMPQDAIYEKKVAKLPNNVMDDLCKKFNCYWWKFKKEDGQFWKYDQNEITPIKIAITKIGGQENSSLIFGNPIPDGWACGQYQNGPKNKGTFINEERTNLYKKYLNEINCTKSKI